MRVKFVAKSAAMVTAAALGFLGLTVPQVFAVGQADSRVAAGADRETKDIAEENPEAVVAAATVCGTGYNLYYAERLPDATRKGTLFTYIKGTDGASNDTPTCAIFENNTGSVKWMKVKLCSNYTAEGCESDEGNFSEYAGPVYRDHGGCGQVTALMKSTSASTTYIVNAVRSTTSC
ncbi:hypothetical protein [Streptomyces sp. NPDC001750]|uniref:hypothetical protein n=1 Tax=Streptomyces sp. NPDC001750 TaxID=3364607 RepID=UPI0036815102